MYIDITIEIKDTKYWSDNNKLSKKELALEVPDDFDTERLLGAIDAVLLLAAHEYSLIPDPPADDEEADDDED